MMNKFERMSRRLLHHVDAARSSLKFSLLHPQAGRSGTVDDFHRLYYDSHVWKRTTWLGVTVWKCPLDLWIYQEILFELRPDLIVETGTAHGGSAYYLASICDQIGNGMVISIDIAEKEDRPTHERIEYIKASSTDRAVIEAVARKAKGMSTVMVILDSDHSCEHVQRELELYSEIVTVGSYLVVEDSSVNGHPVLPSHGPGPMEAIEEFLAIRSDFLTDTSREKFFLTFNPKGFLRKLSVN